MIRQMAIDPWFSFQEQILDTIISKLLKKFQDLISAGKTILPSCSCRALETVVGKDELFL